MIFLFTYSFLLFYSFSWFEEANNVRLRQVASASRSKGCSPSSERPLLEFQTFFRSNAGKQRRLRQAARQPKDESPRGPPRHKQHDLYGLRSMCASFCSCYGSSLHNRPQPEWIPASWRPCSPTSARTTETPILVHTPLVGMLMPLWRTLEARSPVWLARPARRSSSPLVFAFRAYLIKGDV